MSTTPEVVSTPVEKKEKKERKKERKPAEPEPEIYIPLEDREKALEEIQHLFDPSVKKKSRITIVPGSPFTEMEKLFVPFSTPPTSEMCSLPPAGMVAMPVFRSAVVPLTSS